MTSEQRACRLLDELGIKHLSDIDLLVFFARHPRALLASEQLAAYTGYSLQQIAESLEVLVHLGVLRRTTNAAHAARMYTFSVEGPQGSPPTSLLEFVSTREGRLAMKRELVSRSTDGARGAAPGEEVRASARPTLVQPLTSAGDTKAGARRGGIR
jgi:hypothetical protein